MCYMAYNKETGKWEGYIYKIVNDVNDKLYIGQTITTLKERWHGHMSACLMNRDKSVIYKAMRSLGRNNFHIEEVDCVEADNREELISILNDLEQKRIIEYKSHVSMNGYNTERGGDNKSVPKYKVCQYDLELNLIKEYDSMLDASIVAGVSRNTMYGACTGHQYTAGGYVWAIKGTDPVRPHQKKKKSDMNINNQNTKQQKTTRIKKNAKQHVDKTLSLEQKRMNKINRMGLRDERVIQYNSFEEIINIYNDPVEAIEKIPISGAVLKKNLNGKNLRFGETVLRYESDPFDCYPRSSSLQPVSIYDMQGNFIQRFPTHLKAEKFLNTTSGEIVKTLRRGGSCKGYLISEYGKPINRKVDSWNHRKYEIMKDNKIIDIGYSYPDIAEKLCCKYSIDRIKHAVLNNKELDGYYIKRISEYPISI